MGCHELRGYGRVCSSIGLPPAAGVLQRLTYLGSENRRAHLGAPGSECRTRAEELHSEAPVKLAATDHLYPRFWKTVGLYANGQIEYQDIADKIPPTDQRNADRPAPCDADKTVRHTHSSDRWKSASMDSTCRSSFQPCRLARRVNFHSEPMPTRLQKLNIICINGEGGELPEVFGKYKRNRGQQVASARFGVNAEFLNFERADRNQDRTGRETRRRRHAARIKSHSEGRRSSPYAALRVPALAVQQPRPVLDRRPGPVDRGIENGQSGGEDISQMPGRARHRRDRRGSRQGRRGYHQPVGLRRRHRRSPQARHSIRRPARRNRRGPGASRPGRRRHPQQG